MTFTGALLHPDTIQALETIPGLIQAMKLEAAADGQAKQLAELSDHLSSLAKTSGWLDEAKTAHELLQRLQDSLRPTTVAYLASLERGEFDARAYDIANVRTTWLAARNDAVARLLAFAGTIRRLEPEPLLRGNDGGFVSGPGWCQRFISLQADIDTLFDGYSPKSTTTHVARIADRMDELVQYVNRMMLEADMRIRQEAIEMGQRMAVMAGAIGV